jgi:hypothetical protein
LAIKLIAPGGRLKAGEVAGAGLPIGEELDGDGWDWDAEGVATGFVIAGAVTAEFGGAVVMDGVVGCTAAGLVMDVEEEQAASNNEIKTIKRYRIHFPERTQVFIFTSFMSF